MSGKICVMRRALWYSFATTLPGPIKRWFYWHFQADFETEWALLWKESYYGVGVIHDPGLTCQPVCSASSNMSQSFFSSTCFQCQKRAVSARALCLLVN